MSGHFDNEGFKVLIRTRSLRKFSILLVALLTLIPLGAWLGYVLLSKGGDVNTTWPFNHELVKQIISVEILGLLGAVFSVIITYSRKPISGTIPEQKLIYQTLSLRPLIGSAAALVLFILYKAGLLIAEGHENALYALAFVSGFSERFIIDKLDGIAKESSESTEIIKTTVVTEENDVKGKKQTTSTEHSEISGTN